MRVRTLPIADREAVRAARWYERRQRGLGREFLAAFERSLELVEEDPDRCSPYEVPIDRRVFVRFRISRFAYYLLLEQLPDELVLIAVPHPARKPGYWRRRKS